MIEMNGLEFEEIPVFQRDDEWHEIRRGCITASSSECIMTASGKPSEGEPVKDLAYGLAECEAGWHTENDTFQGFDMQRGVELEPVARARYEFLTGRRAKESGIWKIQGTKIAASPDGIIGKDGLLEVKCPKAAIMTRYMRNPVGFVRKYNHQTQFQMMATGRDWVDLVAYCEEKWIVRGGRNQPQTLLVRNFRDDKYIANLWDACQNVFRMRDEFLKGMEK